jgi:hypothetical protein
MDEVEKEIPLGDYIRTTEYEINELVLSSKNLALSYIGCELEKGGSL